MVILRTFSNKEQKRLRRKYDLEQGMKAHHSNFPDGIFRDKTSEQSAAEAKSQAKRLGKDKTNELLKKGRDISFTEKSKYGFFEKRVPKIDGISNQELKEIIQAEDLLRAGRKASRRESNFPSISVEGKEENLNTRINRAKTGGVLSGDRYSLEDRWNLRKAKKAAEEAKEQELQALKKAKNIRNAKIAGGVALGTAAVGTGVYAYKKHKNKKREEDDN